MLPHMHTCQVMTFIVITDSLQNELSAQVPTKAGNLSLHQMRLERGIRSQNEPLGEKCHSGDGQQ